MNWPSLPAWPHADDLTGLVGLAGHALSHPVENTLAAADVYRGIDRAALFPDPPGAPEATIRTRWDVPGMCSEDIIFRSVHQPLERTFARRYSRDYKATHEVYARRVRPAARRDRPRILYIHGYMQPETILEEIAVLASLSLYLDVEIVQMQPPYHGRRSPPGARFGGEYFFTADLVRSVESLRQAALDARTLLSWMLAEDARPVGVMGLSLGGAMSATLACLEPRFAFAIPLIAHMDLDALIADAPVMAGTRRDLRRFGWSRADFARFVDDIGWYRLRPVLPPDRLRIYAADDDRFFDPDVVRTMWRAWGEPRIEWYPGSHMGFLPSLPAVAQSIRAFIDDLPELRPIA